MSAEPALKLHNADEPQAEAPATVLPATPTPQAMSPLLLTARRTAELCSVGESSWWRLHAAGKVPPPVRLGGRTLWRADELKEWVAAGCPGRDKWEALLDAARKGGRRR
jgi:predicted DNA-binding transcriptional regulator AlpA